MLLVDVFSYILKRSLGTYWKTEWHSVCRQFHLKSHHIGEGINSKWFGTCKTLWIRETQCFSKQSETVVQHRQTLPKKAKWSSDKNQLFKYKWIFLFPMLLFTCLCWNEEVMHMSSESLGFTPLNAKVKNLEESPRFYTQVIFNNLDWEDRINRVLYKVFGDHK